MTATSERTSTAALEVVKQGIRVNAVNPGLIDTQVARDVVAGDEGAYAEIAKNVPIGRAGRPEEGFNGYPHYHRRRGAGQKVLPPDATVRSPGFAPRAAMV